MQFECHLYWHKLGNFDIMFHKKVGLVEASSQANAYHQAYDLSDPIINEMQSEWNFLNWVVVPIPSKTEK